MAILNENISPENGLKPEIPSDIKSEATNGPQAEQRVIWFDSSMRALLNNEAFRFACAHSTRRRNVSR